MLILSPHLPGARENPPTYALEKPTRHQPWMTFLYPPGEGGRVVHFSVMGSLVGTGWKAASTDVAPQDSAFRLARYWQAPGPLRPQALSIKA